MPDQPARDAVRAALRRSGLLAAEQYVESLERQFDELDEMVEAIRQVRRLPEYEEVRNAG